MAQATLAQGLRLNRCCLLLISATSIADMAFMKAQKVMKSKRVSFIAKGPLAKAVVFRGSGNATKTSGGFKKTDLMKSKKGKIVTKRMHAAGKKAFKNIKAWSTAVIKARKDLGLTGFVAVKKGTPLYKAAKAIVEA